jgi:hypothetical protein
VPDLRNKLCRFGYAGDIRNIKSVAQSPGAHDSDIIRFAVKSTLSRVARLGDPAARRSGGPAIRGWRLVPMLVASTNDFSSHLIQS